jgi:hypothetical protein
MAGGTQTHQARSAVLRVRHTLIRRCGVRICPSANRPEVFALQGNVRKLGTRWRVSMQFFDSMTQKIADSEKHDFVREDVFEVQDEAERSVTLNVAQHLSSLGAVERDPE